MCIIELITFPLSQSGNLYKHVFFFKKKFVSNQGNLFSDMVNSFVTVIHYHVTVNVNVAC